MQRLEISTRLSFTKLCWLLLDIFPICRSIDSTSKLSQAYRCVNFPPEGGMDARLTEKQNLKEAFQELEPDDDKKISSFPYALFDDFL